MNTYESAFHAIYPDDLADKMCEVADLGIAMSKGLEDDEMGMMQAATMRALSRTQKKYYKALEELSDD